MNDKNVLNVSSDTRKRVNIIKALGDYRTQDDVIQAALDLLETTDKQEATDDTPLD